MAETLVACDTPLSDLNHRPRFLLAEAIFEVSLPAHGLLPTTRLPQLVAAALRRRLLRSLSRSAKFWHSFAHLVAPSSCRQSVAVDLQVSEHAQQSFGRRVMVVTDHPCNLPGPVFVLPQVNESSFTYRFSIFVTRMVEAVNAYFHGAVAFHVKDL